MENESMTLPNVVLQKFVSDIFIETGSYDGRTIQQALDCGFKEVRSVELNEEYYDICVFRFRNEPRVKLYRGDSVLVLPYMLADITKPVTFWLDSHIQEETVGLYAAPVMQELGIIATLQPMRPNTIMIDDRRLMGQEWWKDVHEYDILKMLGQINHHYVIEYFDSKAAADDIIVAHV